MKFLALDPLAGQSATAPQIISIMNCNNFGAFDIK